MDHHPTVIPASPHQATVVHIQLPLSVELQRSGRVLFVERSEAERAYFKQAVKCRYPMHITPRG